MDELREEQSAVPEEEFEKQPTTGAAQEMGPMAGYASVLLVCRFARHSRAAHSSALLQGQTLNKWLLQAGGGPLQEGAQAAWDAAAQVADKAKGLLGDGTEE